MKNIYTITEQEKNRILGMHQNATKKQYLMEQATSSAYAMYQGTEKTYNEDPNSKAMFNMVSTYCTRENLEQGKLPGASNYNDNYELAKNLYYDVMPQYRAGKQALSAIGAGFGAAAGALFGGVGAAAGGTAGSTGTRLIPLSNQEKQNYPNWIKERLGKITTMGDLCEVNSILNDKFKVKTGLHGIFSAKHPDINITWNDVMAALKPAFDDGTNRVGKTDVSQSAETNVQTPEATKEKSNATNTGGGSRTIAQDDIDNIRKTVGSSGSGNTITDVDLDAILNKLKGGEQKPANNSAPAQSEPDIVPAYSTGS